MTKYITIIDHLAGSEKPFTYLVNKGETKIEAVARAVAASYMFHPYYRIMLAKKSGKNKYLPILDIYKDGSMGDLVKNNWYGWGERYHIVTPDMIEELNH
jgi:hypothetical protein